MAPTDDQAGDDHLLRLAGALAEGTTILWEREGPADPAMLRGLREVEEIVAAHRRIAEERHNPPGLQTWAHLTLLEKIGEGSFGAIYRARDERLHTEVALKMLSSKVLHPERLIEEARRLAKVRHPNVVQVYGADTVHECAGLWMELVRGRTVEDLLEAQGPFGAREATLIGLDLCRAMAAVHQAGLVHGDIKARNVMRENGGRIVLMDFGAGRELSAEGSAGAVAGTPSYIAPDVLAGGPATPGTDVYALGVLLFHLVTKSYPIVARSPAEALLKHERGTRLLLRDARPDLPPEFVRVVERAIAPNPAERYLSAGALEAALAALDTPVAARHRRRVHPAAVGAAAVVVAAAVFVGAWKMRTVSSPQPAPAGDERAGVKTAAAPLSYEIDAAFHKASARSDERLAGDSRVSPGDRLFFTFTASVPTYLYIVDEPDHGDPYLLFPLKGQAPANPLPASRSIRLPQAVNWEVTSAGGREHFIVFASPERIEAFEQEFDRLDVPKVGAPVAAMPLSKSAADRFRGVGGLVPVTRQASDTRFASLFTTPLTQQRETATGLWIRQLTVDNP